MWAYLAILLLVPFVADAYADSNSYLSVSAENPAFDNHFAGSMVVEVVVSDPNLHETSEPEGVPNVTVNGDRLQMVQASNGAWYAYFADVDAAIAADGTTSDGNGLDFGVLCSSSTDSEVFGASFSDSEGFFVPSSDGLDSTTGSITSRCTGDPTDSNDVNVVRRPPALNQNDDVLPGQIGLKPEAWPVIQLFSFSKDVTIRYEPAGSPQQVVLRYDEIPGITAEVDREIHPAGSEVFVFVSDIQLNQDPTDWDSWTFQTDSPAKVFYHAFDRRGNSATNNNNDPTDLYPFLGRLGFEDNGFMEIDPGRILKFKPNGIQQPIFASSDIITLVEDKPNSGMFVNYDRDKISNLGVSDTAPRGHPGYIQYNDDTISVLTGSSTASLSTKPPITIEVGESRPGTKIPVLLIDSDQNLNPTAGDDLLVSRASASIPTIRTGSPLTLENAGDLRLYASGDDPLGGGDAATSSVPDPFSAILHIDAPNAVRTFEKMSVNLGFSAGSLSNLLAVSEEGSGWINLDLRSLEELGVDDFSSTGIRLSFGSLSDPNPVTVVNPGDLSSPQQLLLIDPSVIQQISSRSGTVFAVIDLGPSAGGSIGSESSSQPIVLDFFSFGVVRNDVISNAVYRMELEEDWNTPGNFRGSIEYVIADPAGLGAKIADRIVPTGSDVVLAVSGNDRIVINYSDLALVEITILSSEVGIQTHSGAVSYSPSSLRFGHPVTVRLVDPDLNTSSDRRDVYRVIDDPASPGVDTVGSNGHTLLEVKIKNVRYQRCMVDGVEHGGLASTGFVLSETGPSTGVFEGSFAMPSWICDKTGSKLISPGGGSIDLIYHDSQDASGNQNIFSLNRPASTTTPTTPTTPTPTTPPVPPARPDSPPVPPMLSHDHVSLQDGDSAYEVVMSGSIGSGNGGAPLSITVTNPDMTIDTFRIPTVENGNYRSVITITPNSLPGQYTISLSHEGDDDVGTLLFSVISDVIPDWVRDDALGWSSGASSNDGFVNGVRHMIAMGIVDEPGTGAASEPVVPDWVRYTAGLWAGGLISDEEFVHSVQYLIRNGIIQI